MARVLFAWQLGGGSGHLIRLLPLATGLVRAGHTVFVAFRHLARAVQLYGNIGVRFLQAPAKSEGRPRHRRPITFAHLLANTGFGRRDELFAIAAAWRNLFLLAKPHLIIFDHAPGALLAARGLPARRALIGTGFCCPRDVHPLPIMRTLENVTLDPSRVAADEAETLANVNWLLAKWHQPLLKTLGQLYADTDEIFLTTFEELDHCPGRTGSRYWGPITAAGGSEVAWPNGTGGRVFAYLKSFPAIQELMSALRAAGNPTLVYSDGIQLSVQSRFQCETVQFTEVRPNPSVTATACDVAVLNGTHGSTCDMLLAGKPMLQIPLYGEQESTARAVVRLGAGIRGDAKGWRKESFREALSNLLSDRKYADAAGAFAARYRCFDPIVRDEEMLARAIALLQPRGAGATQFLS